MLSRHDFPVLEFDDSPTARLNPENLDEGRFDTDKLVITFFPEVIDRLAREGNIIKERAMGGEGPFDVYRFKDKPDTLLILGQVGCPACGGNLDQLNGMGISKVMFCGGGGVLDKSIGVGEIMVVDGAIRDEGFSYQYIPPSRVIYSDRAVADNICRELTRKNIPHFRGLAWTTDAIFRETRDRIARRREEGARIVEMEQAGCIAVAQFRGFKYGALIYGGDDMSGEKWDKRGWNSRKGVRYDLVRLCAELVGII